MMTFNWVGTQFKYDANVIVKGFDMAIELYDWYRRLDPRGVGNVYIESVEDGFSHVWKNEFGETIAEMFEHVEKDGE